MGTTGLNGTVKANFDFLLNSKGQMLPIVKAVLDDGEIVEIRNQEWKVVTTGNPAKGSGYMLQTNLVKGKGNNTETATATMTTTGFGSATVVFTAVSLKPIPAEVVATV